MLENTRLKKSLKHKRKSDSLFDTCRFMGYEDLGEKKFNSIAQYLTDKGEQTALYKVNKNVYTKYQK